MPQACARTELTASLVIDPKKDDPGLRSVNYVSFDGDHIAIGVETGESASGKDRVMVYDTSGKLISQWDGGDDGVSIAGGTVYSYTLGIISAHDVNGQWLYYLTPGRFGIMPGGLYNSTEAVVSEGE